MALNSHKYFNFRHGWVNPPTDWTLNVHFISSHCFFPLHKCLLAQKESVKSFCHSLEKTFRSIYIAWASHWCDVRLLRFQWTRWRSGYSNINDGFACKKPYFLIKYLKIKLLNPSLCMLKTLKTFLDWMVRVKKLTFENLPSPASLWPGKQLDFFN